MILLTAALASLPPIAFLSSGYREVPRVGVDCDLNGDGTRDTVRLLVDDATGRAMAVAVVVTDKVDTFVVETLSAAEVPSMTITSVALGSATTCNAFRMRGQTYQMIEGEISGSQQ